MNKYLKAIDATIDINQIIEEQEFWNFFDNDNEVKNLNFSLTVPNLFDASNDATNFLNDARDNVGASNVSLNFSNSEGKLRPNKNGIESFVKYTSAGGGIWHISYKDKNGETRKVSSKQKSKKICMRFFKDEINNLENDKINLIKFEMQKIETIEKFKEESNEKKIMIISAIVIISFFIASTANAFIVNVEALIPFLFTILGLSITAYTFIYAPISEILKKETMQSDESKQKLQKLLTSFEEDMMLIFFLTITIIVVDFLKFIDIPLVKNVLNLDLGILKIISLKEYIFNFIISISACLSFYSLYDLMQATFKILRKSFDK